jgi:hypothetical protein
MKLPKQFWLAMVLLLILIAAGCGGAQDSESGGEDGGGGQEAASPVDPATAGAINGKVNFTGTAPDPQPILMDAEPVCMEKHPDGVASEAVVVNGNNTLKNVFVYVKDGLPDGMEFPTPSSEVVLDQTGCVYVPHVFGMQVNQDMVIRNSDGILHNIHPVPQVNRPYNLGQPVAMDSTKTFDKVEMYIPIGCDVHEWMSAYVSVLDHPYFATTGDDGTFSLPNLPPGTYTVVAWHEEYGEQTMSVTVGEQETKEIEFSFAGN